MTIALVEMPAPNHEQDDHRKNPEVKMVPRANKGRLLALAERWLRPADQLDYIIRQWMIPVPFEANPVFGRSHKHSRGASRSALHAAFSRAGNGLLSEVRAVIGQSLRARCMITQPIPARRVVRQFERPKGYSEW